tara:strand:- start:111 stop:443 length:333 start_codon:yes stop_codon:yes gene_type:complete
MGEWLPLLIGFFSPLCFFGGWKMLHPAISPSTSDRQWKRLPPGLNERLKCLLMALLGIAVAALGGYLVCIRGLDDFFGPDPIRFGVGVICWLISVLLPNFTKWFGDDHAP